MLLFTQLPFSVSLYKWSLTLTQSIFGIYMVLQIIYTAVCGGEGIINRSLTTHCTLLTHAAEKWYDVIGSLLVPSTPIGQSC